MGSAISKTIGTRVKPQSEAGFTLVELLVMTLIVGILTAFAIPSFLNQRDKSEDACAKAQARTMATSMETYYTANNTYSGATMEELHEIEIAVTSGGACGPGTLAAVSGAAPMPMGCDAEEPPGNAGYCVMQSSAATSGEDEDHHIYVIRRAANESITRYCTPMNEGGCRNGIW